MCRLQGPDMPLSTISRRVALGALFAIFALSATGCETAKAKMFEAAMQKQRKDTGFVLQHATVDGLEWAYLDQGDGPETVLLIHGFSANKDTWLSPAIEPLRARYRIIAPDLPGFGDSTYQPALDYSFPAQAERVVAFMDHLGLDKVHVVGASMGGGITLALAVAHSDRLWSASVLTAAGVQSPEQSAFFQALERGEPNWLLVRTEEDFDRMLPMVFAHPPEVPPAAKPFVVAELSQRYDQHAAIFQQMSSKPVYLNDRLSQISVPLLAVWGNQDRILHQSATDVIAAEVPQATVKILDGCGHALQGDCPGATATALMTFLEGIGPAQTESAASGS